MQQRKDATTDSARDLDRFRGQTATSAGDSAGHENPSATAEGTDRTGPQDLPPSPLPLVGPALRSRLKRGWRPNPAR